MSNINWDETWADYIGARSFEKWQYAINFKEDYRESEQSLIGAGHAFIPDAAGTPLALTQEWWDENSFPGLWASIPWLANADWLAPEATEDPDLPGHYQFLLDELDTRGLSIPQGENPYPWLNSLVWDYSSQNVYLVFGYSFRQGLTYRIWQIRVAKGLIDAYGLFTGRGRKPRSEE